MKSVYVFYAMLNFVLFGNVFAALNVCAESMPSIGYVEKIEEKIVIKNKNMPGREFELSGNEMKTRKGWLYIYKGDAIEAIEGIVILRLIGAPDGSGEGILSLAPGAKLVINRYILDSNQKMRSSFIDFISGAVRICMKKMEEMREWKSKVKVKTEMVVAGAEGSDFILSHDKCTMVISLEDTHLTVQPLYEANPVLLKPFQYVTVCKGRESIAKDVTQEELETIRGLPIIASRSARTLEGPMILLEGDLVMPPSPPETRIHGVGSVIRDEVEPPEDPILPLPMPEPPEPPTAP